MDWKNQLTKTPYLVLFIVLIAVGVGTASALITITLAGEVFVTENLHVAKDLFIGNNDTTDDKIWFDDGNEFIMWDDSQTQFEIRDDIVTADTIQAGNAGPNVAYNRIGIGTADSGAVTTNDDLYIKGDLEVDGGIYCPNCIDPSDLSRFGSAFFAITNGGGGGTGCYLGEVRLFAGSAAPGGWLPAEGQTLLISQNSALFSLLGTMYGGNGMTEFNLPDLSDINPKSANDAGLNYVICTVGLFPN